ncbi:hypothetical protein [Kitasatospora cheerisanensis]|uniref:hypothetical protein n=1 Tax=Kitasatospora cheerisanensis TaxID=81942 RepID=UPI000A3FBC1F|nr:hypothetical protein [Kitasatospora cheerisanensis]
MGESHPLLGYFLDAAEGKFPPVDGGVTVLPALADGLECSVAFTGHAVVATALGDAEVRAQQPDGFGESMAPDFLRRLAGPAAGSAASTPHWSAAAPAGPSDWGRWTGRTGTPGCGTPASCAAPSACTATGADWSRSPKASPDGAS